MYGSIYLLFPYKMNWRDRLRVNISKKITTNRQTKKGKKKKKEGIPQTKLPAFGQQTVTYYA